MGSSDQRGDEPMRNERAHRNPRAWETTIAAHNRQVDAELEAKLEQPAADEPKRADA
jgi:hypothetical protein